MICCSSSSGRSIRCLHAAGSMMSGGDQRGRRSTRQSSRRSRRGTGQTVLRERSRKFGREEFSGSNQPLLPELY